MQNLKMQWNTVTWADTHLLWCHTKVCTSIERLELKWKKIVSIEKHGRNEKACAVHNTQLKAWCCKNESWSCDAQAMLKFISWCCITKVGTAVNSWYTAVLKMVYCNTKGKAGAAVQSWRCNEKAWAAIRTKKSVLEYWNNLWGLGTD